MLIPGSSRLALAGAILGLTGFVGVSLSPATASATTAQRPAAANLHTSRHSSTPRRLSRVSCRQGRPLTPVLRAARLCS